MSGIYETAVAAHEAGLCVIPAAEDGSKQPLTLWKIYQQQRPRLAQLRAWYAEEGRTGLVYVMGPVSGNLECLEFDERDVLEAFLAAADGEGLAGVVERVRAGYEEETPGAGVHWPYRCAEIAGNTALARRPKRPEEMRNPADKTKIMIETRGIGGCMIAAPSYGTVHPTGKPYLLVRGGVGTIATITPEERAELFALARSFDRMPQPEIREHRGGSSSAGGTRPGDDLNLRVAWTDILQPHGWTPVYERNGATYWRRPGKDRGVSGTTNYKQNGLLWVFTSSTEFEPDRSYTKFGAYAALEFNNDFRAAARFLSSRGYGAQRPLSVETMAGGHARVVTRTVCVA